MKISNALVSWSNKKQKEIEQMNCPYCASSSTRERKPHTVLGYRTYYCRKCQGKFNERTGTPFNYLEYPTDIVMLVVFYRLPYKLSLREIAEMFLLRGCQFTHETVRDMDGKICSIDDRLSS